MKTLQAAALLCLALGLCLIASCNDDTKSPAEPALVSIAVTTPPDKTGYYQGEAFDPAGLVIAGTYDDGGTEAVTGYTLSEPDMTTAGEKTVTVTLGALTTEFTITVARKLASIAVSTRPDKTAYYPGEAFDPAGLVVAGTYEDGGTGEITGYALSEPDMTTGGEKAVTVTLGALTTEFTITVSQTALVSIAVTRPPDKTGYHQGETFDPAGLVVTGTYEDGETREITGYALSEPDMMQTGFQTITLAMGSLSTEFTITIGQAALVSIAVTSPPAKTLYLIGETFDSAGMVLTGTYTDGTTQAVTGFAVAAVDTSAAGVVTVSLALEGKNAETRIYVTGGTLASLTIKTPPDKGVYFPGDSLDVSGLELEGVYTDLPGDTGFPITVTAQDVAGYNSQTRGPQTLTVTVGGASAEFTILLRDEPSIYFDYGRRRTNLDPGGNGYTVPLYRTLVLTPIKWFISDSATYRWELDGVAQAVTGEYLTLNFNRPDKKGTHTVKVTVTDGSVSAVAETLVECVDQEGKFRRDKDDNSKARSNKVFDFVPAPGQFVSISAEDTQETVLAQAQAKNDDGTDGLDWRWSLGSWGGYIILGFDHSIMNVAGEYDITIAGNGFGDWAEPGVVWVSQDDNGNGLPDDTWYELKGSEYGNPETIQRYAVNYYRPSGDKGPVWIDNQGNSGSFPDRTYYGVPQGYPYHAGGDYVILTGTRLRYRVDFGENAGGIISNPGFEWGYVDNDGPPNGFKIENAIQADGTTISLKYIDFVKIHTGQNAYAGILGEISTETSQAYDFSMFH